MKRCERGTTQCSKSTYIKIRGGGERLGGMLISLVGNRTACMGSAVVAVVTDTANAVDIAGAQS